MANITTKLTGIGNSTGVVIPKDTLAAMRLQKGDEVTLVHTDEGLLITPYDADHEAQVETARRLMGRYRNTMKELAK